MKSKILIIAITAALIYPLPSFSRNSEAEKGRAGTEQLSLDEVLTNYYNAIGGLESWSRVDTMIIEGVLIIGDNEFPTTAINMRPDKCRVEHIINGQRVVQAYNGRTAWQRNPLSGDSDASKITGDGAVYIEEKCDIEGPLIGYRNKKRKVTLEGKESKDGRETYKVQVVYDTGNLQTYFLDTSTFLPVMTVAEFKMDGKKASIITFFDDYRKVQKIVVPYRLKFDETGKGPGKELKVESVSVNAAVDSGIFSMPQGSRPAP